MKENSSLKKEQTFVEILDGTSVYLLDGSGWIQNKMSNHWVIVTRIYKENGKVMLKVSTWGGYAYLDLDLWRKGAGWPQSMVYFKRE